MPIWTKVKGHGCLQVMYYIKDTVSHIAKHMLKGIKQVEITKHLEGDLFCLNHFNDIPLDKDYWLYKVLGNPTIAKLCMLALHMIILHLISEGSFNITFQILTSGLVVIPRYPLEIFLE